MRYTLCLAALAATVATATPAFAQQASAQAEARGVVLQSLTLSRISDLDFGTVAGDTVAGGSVSINPDTGVRSTAGNVAALPGAVSRARFDGYGEAGATVTVTLNQPAAGVLCNGVGCVNTIGALLSLDSGGTSRTIGGTGTFSIFVGGDFTIAANQPAGLYSANFDVTANY